MVNCCRDRAQLLELFRPQKFNLMENVQNAISVKPTKNYLELSQSEHKNIIY